MSYDGAIVTTALSKNRTRSGRLEAAPPAPPSPSAATGWRSRLPLRAEQDRSGWATAGSFAPPVVPAAVGGAGRFRRGPAVAGSPGYQKLWRIALLISPGIWVLIVLSLSLGYGDRVQLLPLLAAAPAIACAGTGRRQCVVLGCGCALFALVPIPQEPPTGLGERIGTALAVLAVACSSYLIAHRRLRMQRSLDELRRIADVAQRVLLRPVPERIGPVSAAVGYLAAAAGARIGGDFYEVLETPYGLRAILGDMRGNGLAAVGGAAALLGAFREAGAVEPDLAVVAARLDAALTRHSAAARPVRSAAGTDTANGDGPDGPDLRAEDFATAVIVQVPLGASPDPAAASAHPTAQVILCGHPAPYLLHPAGRVRLLSSDDPTPPLGMRMLTADPQAVTPLDVALEPGESLFCYTDGITESRNRSGVFFPLAEVLAGTCAAAQPSAIAEAVRVHLIAHTKGTVHDDAAVLVLRRLAD